MKKIIFLFIAFSCVLTNIYASSIDITVLETFSPTNISYILFENNNLKQHTSSSKSNTLNENGITNSFSIKAFCNLNSDKSIIVNIIPGSFKAIENTQGISRTTKITPEVIYTHKECILKAGLNENTSVLDFYLKWNGDKEIPSGEYESNVLILYSIK